MQSMNPHIRFPGNARETLGFYQVVLGGELEFHAVGDRTETGLPRDAIFHGELRGKNFTIMGADISAEPGAELTDRISLHILCSDRAEIERVFAALSEGGEVHCGLGPAFGRTYGMVKDRFGISWHLTLPD